MARVRRIDFEDHVRRAVRASSLGEEKIADAVGLSHAKMRNFMEGRLLPQRTLEGLADELGLVLTWRGRLLVKIVEAPKAKGGG